MQQNYDFNQKKSSLIYSRISSFAASFRPLPLQGESSSHATALPCLHVLPSLPVPGSSRGNMPAIQCSCLWSVDCMQPDVPCIGESSSEVRYFFYTSLFTDGASRRRIGLLASRPENRGWLADNPTSRLIDEYYRLMVISIG